MKERYAQMIAGVLEEHGRILNDEPIEPRRWLTMTAWKADRFITTYDTKEEALAGLAQEIWGADESAFFPHALWDLDTGASFPLQLCVEVKVHEHQPLMEPNLKLPELMWTVVGIYEGTGQRFAQAYEAVDPLAAERMAKADDEGGTLAIAGVFPGEQTAADVYAT